MIDRIINTKIIKDADIVLLGASYEGGISFMGGTAHAPKKIIECLDNNLELFDVDLLCEPSKKLRTAYKEITGIQKIKSEKAVQKISEEYIKLLNYNKFAIMLGGEHIVSLGAFDAIAKISSGLPCFSIDEQKFFKISTIV